MSGSRLAALAIVAAAVLAVPVTSASAAQPGPDVIGTGWTQVNPSKTIQVVSKGSATPYNWTSTTHATAEGAYYDRSGGVETFRLLSNSSNRVEVRVHNDYKTGLRQFEGDLKVASPTENESCMQIFGNDTGSGATTLMIRAYAANGGTLRGAGKVLATGVFGKWVHINVIHDATKNTLQVYVGGKLVASASAVTGTHYFKYGVYGTLQATNAQTQWQNVKFFQK